MGVAVLAAVAGPLSAAARTSRRKVAPLAAVGALARERPSVGVGALAVEQEQDLSAPGLAQPGAGGVGHSAVAQQRASVGAEDSAVEPERQRSGPGLAQPGVGVGALAVVAV